MPSALPLMAHKGKRRGGGKRKGKVRMQGAALSSGGKRPAKGDYRGTRFVL